MASYVFAGRFKDLYHLCQPLGVVDDAAPQVGNVRVDFTQHRAIRKSVHYGRERRNATTRERFYKHFRTSIETGQPFPYLWDPAKSCHQDSVEGFFAVPTPR